MPDHLEPAQHIIEGFDHLVADLARCTAAKCSAPEDPSMLTVKSQSWWSWGTNCRNHCSFPLLASSTIIAAVYKISCPSAHRRQNPARDCRRRCRASLSLRPATELPRFHHHHAGRILCPVPSVGSRLALAGHRSKSPYCFTVGQRERADPRIFACADDVKEASNACGHRTREQDRPDRLGSDGKRRGL
jgi:hypothetical protein